MLRTLEQNRANFAWECIQEIKKLNNEKVEKNYNSYVKKTSALIQTSGLGNTLVFYKSKFGNESEEKLSSDKRAYKLLYENLNEWFKKKFRKEQEIIKWIVDSNTSSIETFQVTREILALLSWMKRFAEAELKGEGE